MGGRLFPAKFVSPTTYSSKPKSNLTSHEAFLTPPFKLIPPSYMSHAFCLYICGSHRVEPLRSPSKKTYSKEMSWLTASICCPFSSATVFTPRTLSPCCFHSTAKHSGVLETGTHLMGSLCSGLSISLAKPLLELC